MLNLRELLSIFPRKIEEIKEREKPNPEREKEKEMKIRRRSRMEAIVQPILQNLTMFQEYLQNIITVFVLTLDK